MPAHNFIPVVLLTLGFMVPGASPAPTEYLLDREHSRIWVETHRSGLLSFLGHEHAIVPGEWSGRLCLADPLEQGATGSLVVETSTLVIDSDSARAIAGMGRGPGPHDVRTIQRKMLDAQHLDAEHHPEIRLDLLSAGPVTERGTSARIRLALHGTTREFDVPVRIGAQGADSIRLAGRLRIRQRDFGIRPESIGGVVNVSNEVDLHFDLLATRTPGPCVPVAPPPADER